ncbi:MAG: hypothetical protein EOO16_09150 [Chitinophagaceae bacterium]|nr:MAG: hypothetical protein EOO16_09150 [Chitinophagaceae bacterium]
MSKGRNNQGGNRGADGAGPHQKGESQPTTHQGAPSISKKGKEPHRADESEGARRNTTKKGPNSI